MSSASAAGLEPPAPFRDGRNRAALRWRGWIGRFLFGATLLVLALLAGLDVSLEPAPAAALFVVLCGGAVAWLLARNAPLAETEPERTIGRTLIPLACLLRLAHLVGWYSLAQTRGLDTVGSDAGMYLDWGRAIARHLPVFHDITTYNQAGTYDIGFHYFMGLSLWAFGGNLLAIHLVLVFTGAFGCFLLWQVSRPLLQEKAVWPAILLAVSPLSVSLAGSDLIKDTLLTLFFLLALWGGQEIYRGQYRRGAAALAVAAGFAGARLVRSYAGLVLEAGLIGLPLAVALLRRRRAAIATLAAPLALVVAVFAVTEVVLTRAKQPPLAKQILSMAFSVPNNVQLLSGPLGRVENTVVPSPVTAAGGVGPAIAADRSAIPSGFRGRTVHHLFDIVRRVYGPYLWTPIRSDRIEHFLIGNWASYLDSVLWYWALPFGACGIWFLLRRVSWDAWFVAAVVASFSLLLLIFHMSYRQRGSNLMPLLLVSAVYAWLKMGRRARSAVLLAQGTVILALAVAYWIIRAGVGR